MTIAKRWIALGLAALFTAAACSSDFTERNEPKAPELEDISGWINSEPLSIEQLQGKVVLVDFWTYTCVNCIRTFPFLKEWHSKYADKGLVILGIHTPEFEFEKRRENVEAAVAEFGLAYPVAQDNDYGTWDAFKNRFWPAKYLIDKDGHIRYTHFGEGEYMETEQWIQTLLVEAGTLSEEVPLNPDEGPQRADEEPLIDNVGLRFTRELYGGYERSYHPSGQYVNGVAHPAYYDDRDEVNAYTDPGAHLNQYIYLQGHWLNGPESLVHARATQDYDDYLAIKYFAAAVNAVLRSASGESYTVWVTLDGRTLTEENRGADVTFDEEGRSVVIVDEPRMFRLVETGELAPHELRLSSNSDQFSLFAYTFGFYTEGP